MAPLEEPSNIRVFVHWHEQTVFAGEEVKCKITFKNVATGTDNKSQPSNPSDRTRKASSLHSRAKAASSSTPPLSSTGRGHKRSALSLSVPSSSSHKRQGSLQWPSNGSSSEGKTGQAHKRSVSIVSIGSASTVDDHTPSRQEAPPVPSQPPRPMRGYGHGRASSLQILPRGHPAPSSPQSATLPRQSSSPLTTASYPPDRFGRMRNGYNRPNAPASAGGPRRSPLSSPNHMPEFRFPAAPPPPSDENTNEVNKVQDEGYLSPKTTPADSKSAPASGKERAFPTTERPLPAARILSSTSMAGDRTPRSSGEFYAISNQSTETLASDYPIQPNRGVARPSHLRRNSSMSGQQQSRQPENLIMGYAQIQGSFTLDGSLVTLSPFEQVKKKAVVGGRGGGVIGLEPTKQRESGLLKSFGWGNLSTSIGDLWGGSELSTIKEMRGVAASKSVPLLTTPQSILFVDLQLAPGQSQVFEYTFRLPKGLPPTHKGKAVKISYSLVIGTQRAGGVKEQQVRSVETSFRVLGGVNSIGEILGHDLFNPYILLRDEAQVRGGTQSGRFHKPKASRAPATLNEFLNYVDELVHRPRNEGDGGLLSPSAVGGSRRPSAVEERSASVRDAIHFAIMRSNMAGEGQQSPNRFEIARNGMRVGVVMLTRPSYRLGETITLAIDLSDADVPCYAVHTTLETCEKVDPSLAVRSESSIQRVTRKVYVTASDTTLYSRRVVFTPTIPITATPEFITSGVSLEWKIRVEFVVPSHGESTGTEDGPATPHPLLEQISQDERGGLVLAAAENLTCESFDVLVPLRVYGAVGSGLERLERDEASDEGLVV